MEINEFKRELSRLSGLDFFNPKYRELFLKAFPGENVKDGEEASDEAETKDEEQIKDKQEDVEKAEDEREIDKIEEEKAENSEKKDEKAEEVKEESHEIGKDVDGLKEDKTHDELLDARIENALLRGGIREEKLGAAKRLAHSEIHNIEELDKINSILNDFPEWIRPYQSKGFGMDVDRGTDNLTEEEKRLKAMGINPRD